GCVSLDIYLGNLSRRIPPINPGQLLLPYPIALWWGKAGAQRVINFVKVTIRVTRPRIRTEPLLFSCLPRSRNIFSSFFLFDLFIGHLMGFDDFPVPFRIELQCEKKMRRYG